MPTPDLNRVPSYYHKYISLVPQQNIESIMADHGASLIDTLRNLPDDKWNYKYAPDKWTIKELVQHIIDAERIFCYRALRFARKDKTPLPGFEENAYAAESDANRRYGADLIEELTIVQRSTALLFLSFNEEQLAAEGDANGQSIYVGGIGFIVVGHSLHHLGILKERYLE